LGTRGDKGVLALTSAARYLICTYTRTYAQHPLWVRSDCASRLANAAAVSSASGFKGLVSGHAVLCDSRDSPEYSGSGAPLRSANKPPAAHQFGKSSLRLRFSRAHAGMTTRSSCSYRRPTGAAGAVLQEGASASAICFRSMTKDGRWPNEARTLAEGQAGQWKSGDLG
jgi:hypothetical protein